VKENRKEFFDKFAKKRGFDPLIPNHWYFVSHDDILAETVRMMEYLQQINTMQGGATVLHFYSNSVMRAVVDVYPHIQFDEKSFGDINSM
jgi:ribulose-5-phosphate 4-epimerase/fuculose-1-phosphate aldolase